MALTGYATGGYCFATLKAAGDYVAATQFPFFTPVGSVSGVVVSAQSVAVSGSVAQVLTYQLMLSPRKAVNVTYNYTFSRCDVALPVNPTFTPFNPLDAAAFWSFAMTMIVGVWLLAHNAGSIWRFIVGRKL